MCPDCGRRHASDRGDWTGGAEITLLLSAPLLILLFLSLRRWAPLTDDADMVVVGTVAAVLVPLAYRRVKGAWLGLVRAWEGESPRPSPVRDPEWFTDLWEREAEAPSEEPVRLSFRW